MTHTALDEYSVPFLFLLLQLYNTSHFKLASLLLNGKK